MRDQYFRSDATEIRTLAFLRPTTTDSPHGPVTFCGCLLEEGFNETSPRHDLISMCSPKGIYCDQICETSAARTPCWSRVVDVVCRLLLVGSVIRVDTMICHNCACQLFSTEYRVSTCLTVSYKYPTRCQLPQLFP
jgi:hypothetical protein